jgi:TetR/AcrR family transcriptional regulator, transcriptional repressor for nem operon
VELFEMRVSKDEKARTHAAIVKTAAALMRQNGIAQTGVADVMEATGLTHGGFYRHFETKDDLAAAAITHAFNDTLDILEKRIEKEGAGAAVKWYTQRYLSTGHVNNAASGCPVAAIGTEGARLPADVKSILGDGAQRTVTSVAKATKSESEKQSLQIMAAMVGAVVLARCVGDHPIGKNVMTACRELVENSLSKT